MKAALTRVISATALAAAIAGCAIGPDYRRPEVASPPYYRLDTGALAIEADIAWWNTFDDPVLTALVETALRNSYDVRIATARIDEFRGQLMIARSAFYPQIGATAAAARQRSGTFNTLIGTPLEAFSGPRNSYQLVGNASWEIDVWGRIRRQAEGAEADLWNAEYTRRGTVLALAASVVQGYATLRGLDAQLDIARQTLDVRAKAVNIFRQRFEGGVVSQVELVQAENDYYAAESSIPPIRASIAQTENALSVLLGREPGPIERGKPFDALQAPAVGPDMPAMLLSRRPDVLQAEQAAVAANARLGAAEALYLPAVDLSAMFGAIAATPGALWHSASLVWGVGASITQPIFQGGAIRGQVQSASAVRDQAMLAYQASVLNALADVNNALAANMETRIRLASLRRQEQSLVIYADQATARYEGGYTSYLEVTDAREKLYSVQLAAVQGQVDVLTGVATLYKSLGGGWPAVPAEVRDGGMVGDARQLAPASAQTSAQTSPQSSLPSPSSPASDPQASR
ncbi:efflux transporter outer membrane subunit [Cupriavidus plantarum]|uniref:efflux transporter outer membrane subunit n=1 Tax=Cupriavidus plantarum TaxID=942865 RepID=UPI00339D59CD